MPVYSSGGTIDVLGYIYDFVAHIHSWYFNRVQE